MPVTEQDISEEIRKELSDLVQKHIESNADVFDLIAALTCEAAFLAAHINVPKGDLLEFACDFYDDAAEDVCPDCGGMMEDDEQDDDHAPSSTQELKN